MFKFLKDKLKSAVGLFSKKVVEEAPEEEQEITQEIEQDIPVDDTISEDELQQAEDLLDRARGEAKPEEVFEKATGISAKKALERQAQKEEVESAVVKVQKEIPPHFFSPEKKKSVPEEKTDKEKPDIEEATDLSESDFIEQEEVTLIEEAPSAQEILEEQTPIKDEISEEAEELAAELGFPQEEEPEQVKEVPQDFSLTDADLFEAPKEKKGFFSKLKSKFVKKEELPEEKKHDFHVEQEEQTTSEVEENLEQLEKTFKEPEDQPEFLEGKSIEELQEAEELLTTKETKSLGEQVPSIRELQEKKEEREQQQFQPKKIVKHEEPVKKGFFARIKEKVVTKKISDTQFDELFWDLEVALLENNVALEVIEKIKNDLKSELVDQPIPRAAVQSTILLSLKSSLEGLFSIQGEDILTQIKKKGKKPFVICFVGINGSGKTTSIAKVAYLLKQNGKSVVMAAADTFRAAAIDQLQEHADKLKIKLVKHDYGSDAAAVAFDAIKHAEAKGVDVVLIDTAGRLHSNTNLVDEMKKIVKIANHDLKIFVGESITGNDCVEQATQFNEAIGIDGIILSKADIDEKGGAAISISFVTQKPILYLGTGQEYKDLKPFNAKELLASLGL